MKAELLSAFESLQKSFYLDPSAALAPWISAEDQVAQNIITLLNSIITRHDYSGSEVRLRSSVLYIKFAEMIRFDPWCSLIEFNQETKTVKIQDSISENEFNALLDIIVKYHQAIT